MTAPAPMLATRVDAPFTRPGWVFEPKYDGWRVVAARRGGRVSLLTRGGLDLAGERPEIARAVSGLPGGDLAVDGEMVVLDGRGVSSFRLLQERNEPGAKRPLLVLFDCLQADGVSLVSRPLSERRAALEALLGKRPRPPLALAARLGSDGIAAFARAKRKGWEGVVGKDPASRYESGRRSLRWLKVKARKESEFVIAGFTLPKGSRLHFGALLVGLFEGKALRYCGSVGTGFSDEVLLGLLEKLHPLQQDTCSFALVPREVKDAAWVAPKLVAQVAYAEWTGDEKLRQPSFLGLRNDKKARECRWEEREK
ncbi:MAG: non-homologous end-joining DNA ligase [Thermoanaerobaculia bacterium]